MVQFSSVQCSAADYGIVLCIIVQCSAAICFGIRGRDGVPITGLGGETHSGSLGKRGREGMEEKYK